ncbi:MAG: response regulator [Cyclobacteriaceae bacterium]|jgi:two-component SAPR family response regulator
MSQSFSCIAIDDDPLFLKNYEVAFHGFKWLQLLESFEQPIKAATAIIKLKPDVIFLDLEMPHIEGDDLLNWLAPKFSQLAYQPKVILVSSFVGLSSIKHPLITAYFNKQDFIADTELEAQLKQVIAS